jgi:hypothetical protein
MEGYTNPMKRMTRQGMLNDDTYVRGEDPIEDIFRENHEKWPNDLAEFCRTATVASGEEYEPYFGARDVQILRYENFFKVVSPESTKLFWITNIERVQESYYGLGGYLLFETDLAEDGTQTHRLKENPHNHRWAEVKWLAEEAAIEHFCALTGLTAEQTKTLVRIRELRDSIAKQQQELDEAMAPMIEFV